MKNSKKTVGIILLTCIIGVILIFAPKYIFAAVKTALDTYQDKKEALLEDHWVYDENGRKYVYHDGVLIKNTWREIDGVRYCFDENGYVKSGWITDKGSTYYLTANGTPASGWVKDDGKWYYLNSDGTPKTGWLSDNGKWYCLNDQGIMATGWVEADGTSYYMNDDGSMASNCWIQQDGNWYYLNTSGAISTGWRSINDKWYYFREDGVMMIGWITDNGKTYCLDGDGYMITNSWEEKDGKTYYLGEDGTIMTGKITVNNQTYFLNSDGTLVTSDWYKYDNSWYYLDENGLPKTGWLQLDSKWYYLKEDGTMATGELIIDNKKYTFDENGVWDGKSTAVKTTGSGPMVALTFDDGPGQYTERILNTLAANGAKATFFMLGTNIPNYPDAVKKMESLGCELANHTFDHKDLATLDTTAIQNEVSSTNDKLNALVGHGASLVRPPYGSYNSTVKSVIGFPMILWSIDTLDWKTKNAQSTYEAAMTAQDGDVILMHDIHGPTADAIDMIVPALKAKGFQMVTVSELAAAKGINLENGGAYGALR